MGEIVGVVDYGAGNIGSITNMLGHLGAPTQLVRCPEDADQVSRLILPGVGNFDHGVRQLRKSGLFDVLSSWDGREKPLLGICLGMQLLLSSSQEGVEEGLGLIPGENVRLKPLSGKDKVPHMGWNTVVPLQSGSALDDQEQRSRYYFVHSYAAQPIAREHWLATTSYLGSFCSAVTNGYGILGYQFHPEKSHRYGMSLMRSFACTP